MVWGSGQWAELENNWGYEEDMGGAWVPSRGGRPAWDHIALQARPSVGGDILGPRSISTMLCDSEKVTYKARLQTYSLCNEGY